MEQALYRNKARGNKCLWIMVFVFVFVFRRGTAMVHLVETELLTWKVAISLAVAAIAAGVAAAVVAIAVAAAAAHKMPLAVVAAAVDP